MTTKPSRCLFWAAAILVAGAILAASPSTSSAQGLSGWGMYPAWGYNVGMPGYYSNFRAQSYYAAPWIAGYESPWYGPGCYGCGYDAFGYGGCSYGGMGRYPWIWNRHAGFVTRGFVAASPPASVKVYKNPFYKPGESSPSDAPKTTSKPVDKEHRISIRAVSNPYYVSK